MYFTVDKRTAQDWLTRFHQSNEERVGHYPEKQMVDVALFSAELARAFIRCLSERGTSAEMTQIVEAASHGMLFAIAQELLNSQPHNFEPPQETVN